MTERPETALAAIHTEITEQRFEVADPCRFSHHIPATQMVASLRIECYHKTAGTMLSFVIIVSVIAMIAPLIWLLVRSDPRPESQRRKSKRRRKAEHSALWAGGDLAAYGNSQASHAATSSHHTSGSHIITNSASLHACDGIDGDGGE